MNNPTGIKRTLSKVLKHTDEAGCLGEAASEKTREGSH